MFIFSDVIFIGFVKITYVKLHDRPDVKYNLIEKILFNSILRAPINYKICL